MRLGEMLVNRGLIGPQELDEALSAQLIYGGTLGTCLIEMGFLEEQELGRVLSEVFSVGCAPKEAFDNVSRFIIGTVPEPLVRKHNAVPFGQEERILAVAMVDPTDLQAIDELSFATGYRIQPWIAPEVRIYQAMERYYDVPRRQRYVALCRQLDKDEPGTDPQETQRFMPLAECIREVNAHMVSASPTTENRPQPTAAAVAMATMEAPVEQGQPDALAELMCRAESWEELTETVLNRTAHGMARNILFRVKGNAAFVWKTRGLKLDMSKVRGALFPIVQGSVLGLLRGSEFYRGPVPMEDGYLDFYCALQMSVPAEAMVLPLYAQDRLIALFYGDGGQSGDIAGTTEEYRRLMRRLALALNLVLLKREIRSA
jgi:hypothetical protein